MSEDLKKNIDQDIPGKIKNWRIRIFFTVWVTYMIYYIGRVNLGIAKPLMMAEFDISSTIFGGIGSAFFYAYAFGQFFNGFLGDKLGPRRMVTLGIIVSSGINLIIGVVGQFVWVLGILWGLNGFFQAMGWAPSVKTIANWFPPKQRGKWSGRLGTSYMIGGALAWVIAILITVTFGLTWQFAFIIPGIIMLIIGIINYVSIRNAPEEVGLPTIEEESEGKIEIGDTKEDEYLGFKYTLKAIFSNKTVIFAAFGLFCLNMVRYGITEWLPTLFYFDSAYELTLWKTIAFPVGGAIGALTCTMISDKFLKRRRMPIISILFGLLAITLYIYSLLPPVDLAAGIPMLMLIGFLTFGPHVLLVSTIPMEFGTRKAASSVTGFIDGFGYIGAAISTQVVGIILDTPDNMDMAYLFWIIAALAGCFVLLFNWKSVPKKKEYF
ncbi:MFS transporter [Promethearchaeum syntrophicum]|uniref:MFS transporter n=1 Tax=Promethearchaeum syntrophicum TaxID=2594042 RepID=A0A5B9D9X7_9ARCH|nr:MFS transporter [Candidatus Prometheoarchaeum syntrophicum]QEE16068.1 regulatory protein UhpC [Candidatus Prometheoarchaeum syntrophicum]